MTIQIGDRVGYRVRWLRSTGACHGPLSRARGVVKAIKSLGSLQLAEIEWGNPDMPTRVAVTNLARVGTLAFTSEDR